MIEVDYIEFSMRQERFAEVFPDAFSLSNARPILTFNDKRYVLLSAEWPDSAEEPVKCAARLDVYAYLWGDESSD